MSSAGRLEGWAQIEDYLDLTRNTILARGYPVRKIGGVFAFCIANPDDCPTTVKRASNDR